MGRTTRDAVLIVVTLLVDETWLVVEPGILLVRMGVARATRGLSGVKWAVKTPKWRGLRRNVWSTQQVRAV
jgi:hypothetical protein